MTVNAFESVPLDQLANTVRNVKSSMMRVLDMSEKERNAEHNGGTAAGAFSVKMIALQRLEEEIVRRGLDPGAPEFGPDIMRDIAEVEAELIAERGQI